MDILFGPTPDAIRAVTSAILATSTAIPCSSQAWDEAESALCQAMIDANGRNGRNGGNKIRCRVSFCNGQTMVDLLGPDQELGSVSFATPSEAFMVYSDPGSSIWLADDL